MTAVTVRVPATSANLGPGFDALGLALAWYDEITVGVTSSGTLSMTIIGEGTDNLPRDEGHLVVRAIRAAYDRMGAPEPGGLALACTNRIPHGRGLGSSAAAIVAGVVAARALVPGGEVRLPDDRALALASELEGHPDNVAACLLGGLTVAWTGQNGARALRLEPADLTVTALVPDTEVATATARGLLPDDVPHRDAARNAGRSALLIGALTAKDPNPDLLLAGTEDVLHQRYRAPAMPDSYTLVEKLRSVGIPAVISGAGPTVLAFVNGTELEDRLGNRGISRAGFHPYTVAIDRSGAATHRAQGRRAGVADTC